MRLTIWHMGFVVSDIGCEVCCAAISAAACPLGKESAFTYLRYPESHRTRIRSTNMLERVFKEAKRKTREERFYARRGDTGYVQ